jgi:mannose-6-phosphate isomerase
MITVEGYFQSSTDQRKYLSTGITIERILVREKISMILEPFMLKPEYREYIWGGSRIRPQVGRTAEAWLVYEEDVVADGAYAGKTLSEVAASAGEALLGRRVMDRTGDRFPLLIKLLDCADWLSLQVHPNNTQAEFWEGPGHFGKTEGWYIAEADARAELISGFRTGITKVEISNAVGTSALLDIAKRRSVSKGDALLISPGTMHALGPGLLVYEVQQTSDITYRVYDWDRPLKDGRKLHLEQAADVLDPTSNGYFHPANDTASETKTTISCEFFELKTISNTDASVFFDTDGRSFHCLTMIEGEGIVDGEGWQRKLKRFETIVIPANAEGYHIHPGKHTCLVARVPE